MSTRRRSNDFKADAASDDDDDVDKHKKSATKSSKAEASAAPIAQPDPEPDVNRDPEYIPIYSGISQSYDARNLDPATTYVFRVCAVNAAGTSEWSPTKEVTTPAASPAPVTGLQVSNYILILRQHS